jgi:hypothetical protein
VIGIGFYLVTVGFEQGFFCTEDAVLPAGLLVEVVDQ